MAISEIMTKACAAVRPIVLEAADADLDAATPCQDWDVRALVNHFSGTSGAFARLGRGDGLDPDDPWGSKVDVAEQDWAPRLAGNLDTIGSGWSATDRWQGSVDAGGQQMPMQSLGEIGFIEVLLHGWDLARAGGRSLEVDEETAAELFRAVGDTAELGRKMEAFGPEVPVSDDASDFDRALGLAGRDPSWGREA